MTTPHSTDADADPQAEDAPKNHVDFWYECSACAESELNVDARVRITDLQDHSADIHPDEGTVWFTPLGRGGNPDQDKRGLGMDDPRRENSTNEAGQAAGGGD